VQHQSEETDDGVGTDALGQAMAISLLSTRKRRSMSERLL
jgi:hypothetical protein